eukprot:8763196-Pyramimonas_sp.AAC.1
MVFTSQNRCAIDAQSVGRGATRVTARLPRTWTRHATLRKCAAPRGNDAPRGGWHWEAPNPPHVHPP